MSNSSVEENRRLMKTEFPRLGYVQRASCRRCDRTRFKFVHLYDQVG